MSTEIGSRFQSHDEPITPSKLLDLLKSAVRHFSDTFIIIDALDEYSKSGTGDEFFKGLEELLDSDIHLLITSRHNLMTEHIFQNKASRIEIDLRDITAIQKDIVQYLHYRIRESPRLNRYVEPDLQNKIIETITKEADGV
jgi:tRNA(His) 5'-end guanylyltransferase